MDRRLLTSLAVSAALAACVAAVFYRLVARSTAHAGPQVTKVVYASASLPVGAKIRPSDVKLVSVPVSMKPRDSYARIEDVVDRPVIAAIMQDEPILKERLAEPGSGAGLAPMIPPGFRALSVRVNDVIGVAGYVQPGMKVDVLVTGHPPDSQETITRTVLQNVPVLSAGHVLQPEPNGQAINATVVTLQVTLHEAETLTLATDGGHIQLVLRNSTDVAVQPSTGAQLSAMYGATKPRVTETAGNKPHPAPRAAPVPQPASLAPPDDAVEVIRGAHRTLETVHHFSVRNVGTK